MRLRSWPRPKIPISDPESLGGFYMNQEDVHLQLKELHECREPFTVSFSGKKNGKINGTYNPPTREITIHNRNFIDDEGQAQEPALFYTAMHELAHHIQFTEYGQKGARSHTKLFHAILDGLADKAAAAGLYQPEVDGELQALADEANKISCEIARLQRELGAVLFRLSEACKKKGARYEDVLKRGARISIETSNKATKIAALDLPGSIGADSQEAIAGERDEEKRRAMIQAAMAGKSVAQVKRAGSSPGPTSQERETDNLLQEKARLEKTIESLQRRLREVMQRLNSPGGLRSPCAAEKAWGS